MVGLGIISYRGGFTGTVHGGGGGGDAQPSLDGEGGRWVANFASIFYLEKQKQNRDKIKWKHDCEIVRRDCRPVFFWYRSSVWDRLYERSIALSVG